MASATLARLAAELGFADQSHLCRVTRSETGLTPSELRAALEQHGDGRLAPTTPSRLLARASERVRVLERDARRSSHASVCAAVAQALAHPRNRPRRLAFVQPGSAGPHGQSPNTYPRSECMMTCGVRHREPDRV